MDNFGGTHKCTSRVGIFEYYFKNENFKRVEAKDSDALLKLLKKFRVKAGHLILGFDCVLDALRYTPLAPKEIKNLNTSRDDFGSRDETLLSEAAMPYFRSDNLSRGDRVVESGFSILLILNGEGKKTSQTALLCQPSEVM